MLDKNKAVGILAGILVVTWALWALTGENELVILVGIAAAVILIMADMLMEIRKKSPRGIRAKIQAIFVCVAGAAVVVYIIVYLFRALLLS